MKAKNYMIKLLNLQKVITIDPDHYISIRKCGEIEGKIFGNIYNSIYYLNQALQIAPNDFTTLENLGVAYGITGDFEKSLSFFYRALEQNPENAQLLRNISLSYRRMGNMVKAQEYLEKSKKAGK